MKYIKFSWLNPPRNAKNSDKIKYIDILGKTFHGNIKISYFLLRVEEQFNGFGNRTKTIAKTDFDRKSSSHSVRIAKECKELLETGFIKFPLVYSEEIKDIKYGNKDMEYVVSIVEETLEEIEKLVKESTLPEKCDRKELDTLLLKVLDKVKYD
jgi:hypothetical protein